MIIGRGKNLIDGVYPTLAYHGLGYGYRSSSAAGR